MALQGWKKALKAEMGNLEGNAGVKKGGRKVKKLPV
jgi:hypothetical protein